MHTYSIMYFKRMSKRAGFIRGLAAIICLAIVLSGLLWHSSKGFAEEPSPSSVMYPFAKTSPGYSMEDSDSWLFHFTSSQIMNHGDKIFIEFPSGSVCNVSPYNEIPYYDEGEGEGEGEGMSRFAIFVNGIPASATPCTGSKLEIQLAGVEKPSKDMTVFITAGAVLNPLTIQPTAIAISTNYDKKPVLIEPGSLSMTVSDSTLGAENVEYTFRFKAQNDINEERPLQLAVSYDYELLQSMGNANASNVLLYAESDSEQRKAKEISKLCTEICNFAFITPLHEIKRGDNVVLKFTGDAGVRNPIFYGANLYEGNEFEGGRIVYFEIGDYDYYYDDYDMPYEFYELTYYDAEITYTTDQTNQQAVDTAISLFDLTDHILKGSMALPSTASNDTTVTWTSSDNSTINITSGTGIVTRPSYGSGNKVVTLTATITKGDVSRQKTILVLVLEAEHVLSTNADLSSLTVGGAAISLIPGVTDYTQSVTNNTYSTIINAVYSPGASMKINGVKVASAADKEVGLSLGSNTFTIVVTAENGTSSKTYQLTIIFQTQPGSQTIIEQQLTVAINLLDPSSFLNGNVSSSQITGDLKLPATTSVENGYPIIWTSSANAFITPIGVVTRPSYTSASPFENVILTATATVTNTTYTSVPRQFSFTVLRAEIPPTQEIAVNASQPIVTLIGGTKIDFTGASFGPNARVTASEVTPLNTNGTGLVSAGKTLEFTLTGITIEPSNPVKVSIPTNANANRSKIGVFYYNPSTLSWEYQKTEIDSTGTASAKVTHFSTYGVFEANKVAAPVWESLFTNDTTKQVTLSTATAGAAIYYTLDGSDPTTISSLYNASNKPKVLSTQTLKAIAVKNGMITSDPVSIVGKARKTISNVLTSILNKADQNGDGQFDQTDVRALLTQVEALNGH
ncbi:Cadherin-like beta sandwich domain-containing protein [Paenibacillus sp. 1_12]|uniref:immunoglobulin-like domain-containing protein n=1 Tax=Paenibacillus sp. 1_12 TaxID=1566278 RepID=UPI0008EF5933|nr:immunoglobulin-like domain-containing protein [Paenibacillus sp. 1_12]SFM07140.1 Cadherin-like beta sandwich domain-containing protein [Paenibacillus sp. 1_12]